MVNKIKSNKTLNNGIAKIKKVKIIIIFLIRHKFPALIKSRNIQNIQKRREWETQSEGPYDSRTRSESLQSDSRRARNFGHQIITDHQHREGTDKRTKQKEPLFFIAATTPYYSYIIRNHSSKYLPHHPLKVVVHQCTVINGWRSEPALSALFHCSIGARLR